jgi:hypothetical protein
MFSSVKKNINDPLSSAQIQKPDGKSLLYEKRSAVSFKRFLNIKANKKKH